MFLYKDQCFGLDEVLTQKLRLIGLSEMQGENEVRWTQIRITYTKKMITISV